MNTVLAGIKEFFHKFTRRPGCISGALVLASALISMSEASSQEVLDEEARVKATYILSFILYTDWPDLEDESGRIVQGVDICSMRGGPFLGFMRDVLEEKKLLEPRYGSVRIHQYENESDEACEVLFIPSELSSAVHPEDYSRDSLLLIGESRGFATSGGIINFIIEDDSVRFEINFEEMQARNLFISSQILRLARIVP